MGVEPEVDKSFRYLWDIYSLEVEPEVEKNFRYLFYGGGTGSWQKLSIFLRYLFYGGGTGSWKTLSIFILWRWNRKLTKAFGFYEIFNLFILWRWEVEPEVDKSFRYLWDIYSMEVDPEVENCIFILWRWNRKWKIVYLFYGGGTGRGKLCHALMCDHCVCGLIWGGRDESGRESNCYLKGKLGTMLYHLPIQLLTEQRAITIIVFTK